MRLAGEKAFVTGACGFIGSHLTEQLLREGCDVVAFAPYRPASGNGWLDRLPADARREIRVESGDVRDPDRVRSAMKGCRIVFHLAALVGIPYSYLAPESYVDTNVRGSLNVLLAARDNEVDKIVHTSTSEVYGTAVYVPMTEEHPLSARSPYAASKIGADQLALAFHRSFGLPVAILRPFNTYGPRQSVRAVIPSMIVQLAQQSLVLRLGAVYPTRDFAYIADTVRAFVAIGASDRAVGETIHAGSGGEIPIGELAALIRDTMGSKAEIVCDGERLRPAASEVARLWADNAKARELLGWEPAYAGREGLERGIHATIAWLDGPDGESLRAAARTYRV